MRTTLAAALLLSSVATAQAAPKVDPALRAQFGFEGPSIRKIGWGIGLLRVARLDESGPAVGVVNNGRRARLELLRCGDEGLEVDTESTDGEISGLAVADVDGDAKRDFLMLTGRGRLITRLRGEGVASIPGLDVGAAAVHDALRAGDLDGDGRSDALVLTREGLRCVTGIAKAPKISPADPVVAQQIRAFHLFDADGDGQLDVVLGTSDDAMALWIKRGAGDGTFGPWIMLDVPKMRSVFPGTGAGGSPTLATVEGGHRRVVEYALRHVPSGGTPAVELTTLPQDKRRSARPFAHGDVDGDGDDDLVIADPERARLILLLESDGAFAMRTVPTLSGVDALALADIDGDGTLDLLLSSAEERALAWQSGAAQADAFPERLPSVDQPMVAAWHEGSILFLARNERRAAALHRITRGEDGTWSEPEKLADLGRMTESPLRMWVADLDGAAGAEIAYVQPGQGLHVLFPTDDGKYQRAGDGDDALMKVGDGAISLVTHDGQPALLAVRERFARTIRFGADRKPVVLAQDHGPEGIEELSLGLQLDAAARAWVDSKSNKAWIVRSGDTAPMSVDVPRFGATHLVAHHGTILLLAKTGVVRVPFGAGSWQLERLRVHEPPTEKTNYYRGLAADLNGDGVKELAIADAHTHGFDVLVANGDTLRRGLSFPVFELPEAGDVYEPRGFDSGDMNGDGLTDLALVCHDRVLVYLQEK